MVIQLWEYMKPWIVQLKLVNYMVYEWYLMKSFLIPHPRIFFIIGLRENETDRHLHERHTSVSCLPYPQPFGASFPGFTGHLNMLFWEMLVLLLLFIGLFGFYYWVVRVLGMCERDRQTDRQTLVSCLPCLQPFDDVPTNWATLLGLYFVCFLKKGVKYYVNKCCGQIM